jgi:hypothetical protein
MAQANAVTPPLQTAAATLEKAKLRKVLSRIDLVLFTACAILGFDTVAASAEAGAQAIPALVRLRKLYPETNRPYRVPGGMAGAWAAAIITEAFVVITAVTLLWPGAINALFGQSYSVEASWGVSRAFFEWVTLGAFGAMVLLGVAFWAIGARNVRRGLLAPAAAAEEEPR